MSNKEKAPQAYMSEAWFAGLMHEVAQSSKAAVGVKMGIKRTVISQVCNGCGPYGDGRASVKRIEVAYLRAFEQIVCTHTQKEVGIDYCRDMALRQAPTQNPMRMMHWQSCQSCQYKPNRSLNEQKISPPIRKIGRVGTIENSLYAPTGATQQAGIIDKVTLPLPVVGAPQVMEAV